MLVFLGFIVGLDVILVSTHFLWVRQFRVLHS